MNERFQVPTAFRIAIRELRGTRQGVGVFVASLFLGVFAISGIGSFSAAVNAGLKTDSRALLGGDIEISLVHRPMTENQKSLASSFGKISAVVNLRAMPHHVSSGRRLLAEVKAVDAMYPLYGNLSIRDGHATHAAALSADSDGIHGAIADTELMRRLGANIGDIIEIGSITLRINAILETEPDRSISLFTLAPRLMVHSEALQASGLLHPGSLATYAYRLRLMSEDSPSAVKSMLDAEYPDAGWRIRTWQEAEPRISMMLDRMTMNLTLTGLCALLAGGVGIGAAVRGYLQSRMMHMATMKSMGASGSLVFFAYLIQLLMIGSMGILSALVAGASVPHAVKVIAGDTIPLPVLAGIYLPPLLLAAWYGILITLLFTLLPLSRACRVSPAALFRGYAAPSSGSHFMSWRIALAITTVAAALSTTAVISSPDRRLAAWFAAGTVICFAVFRVAAWLSVKCAGWLPRPPLAALRMTLAAITRRGGPAPGIIFSLGLGMTALVIVTQVQYNLSRLVSDSIPRNAPACFVMGIPDHQAEAFDALLGGMSAVERHVRQPALRGRITAIRDIPADQAEIDPSVRWAIRGDRFISHAAIAPDGSDLTEGEWWPPDYEGPPLVSLTADVAAGFGVKPGDTITMNILGREMSARIANLRQVDWSSLQLNFAVILNPHALAGAPYAHLATLYTDEQGENDVFDTIAETFPDAIIISTRAVMQNVSATLRRIGGAFTVMASLVLMTGFLVLAGAISADQQRRIRDAVIYKVCGATRLDLMLAFGVEFAGLGLIAAWISVPVGSTAARLLVSRLMNMDYQSGLGTVWAALTPGLILVVLAGLAGTWRVLGHKPASWLRAEDP